VALALPPRSEGRTTIRKSLRPLMGNGGMQQALPTSLWCRSVGKGLFLSSRRSCPFAPPPQCDSESKPGSMGITNLVEDNDIATMIKSRARRMDTSRSCARQARAWTHKVSVDISLFGWALRLRAPSPPASFPTSGERSRAVSPNLQHLGVAQGGSRLGLNGT
jgi:hypothetical protein